MSGNYEVRQRVIDTEVIKINKQMYRIKAVRLCFTQNLNCQS